MRDMDLIRHILLEMETLSEDGPQPGMDEALYEKLQHAGHSKSKIGQHIELLYQARFLEGVDFGLEFGPENASPVRNIRPKKLTWEGYDFLDAIRNESIYKRAKATALEKTGALTFDVVKALATQIARQAAGLG